MIAVDDRNCVPLRPCVVRLRQAATAVGSRDPGSTASTQCPSAACATPTAFAVGRSRSVRLALSVLPSHSCCHNYPQARDSCALASNGFCRVLAMEVPSARRPAADRQRGARPDPKNEFGEPALGRSQDPWGTAQTGHPSRPVHGFNLYGASPGSAVADLEDLRPQPYGRNCGHRSLCGSDNRVSATLRTSRSQVRTATAVVVCGDP